MRTPDDDLPDSEADEDLRLFLTCDPESAFQLRDAVNSLTPQILQTVDTPRDALFTLFNHARGHGIEFSMRMRRMMELSLRARGSFWSMIVDIRDASSGSGHECS